MSRVTDFDDVYAGVRGRLLLQLYAYCGDAGAADDALTEAFIGASRHWSRLPAGAGVDRWLRDRAVRRLDSRPGVLRDAAKGATSPATGKGTRLSTENLRLLAALRGLDPVSRRLIIVRRLAGTDLPSVAREVGLTDGAAEQALARATTSLHAAGVDTTPAGLAAGLARLGADIDGREPPPPETLRRAGARRRYALTALVAVAVVAVAGAAGAFSAVRPFATLSGSTHHHPTPSTAPPTTRPPPPPLPRLGAGDLLGAAQVASVDRGTGWHVLPPVTRPLGTSVYGDCVMAADNPPPETSWVRDFTPDGPAAVGGLRPLRQVLLQAPSNAEAQRTFRQVAAEFTVCERRQLVDYSAVTVVGDRARLVSLRFNSRGGVVTQTVALVKSGPVVTVLVAESAPAEPPGLTPERLATLAGSAVDRVCTKRAGSCATPPYTIRHLRPPGDGTAGGFLSVADLPLIPGLTAAWAGTVPEDVTRNPSATACDQADFRGNGSGPLASRSYVMPDATKVPSLFGLSETVGRFDDPRAAKAFVAGVARTVSRCHRRQVTLSVLGSTSFSTPPTSARVWQIRQQASKTKVTTFRVALVRRGAQVAEMTFTPAGGYDVPPVAFVALARRAGIRLGS